MKLKLWPRRRRQCSAAAATQFGSATATDYCTRERGHEGPHANAFTQNAWIEKTFAVPVTYRWPYEDLIDDSRLTAKVGPAQYHHTPKPECA